MACSVPKALDYSATVDRPVSLLLGIISASPGSGSQLSWTQMTSASSWQSAAATSNGCPKNPKPQCRLRLATVSSSMSDSLSRRLRHRPRTRMRCGSGRLHHGRHAAGSAATSALDARSGRTGRSAATSARDARGGGHGRIRDCSARDAPGLRPPTSTAARTAVAQTRLRCAHAPLRGRHAILTALP